MDEDILTERILERSKTSGRNDDNPETLKKRFNQFTTEQMLIINRYAEMGRVRKIDGMQEVDKVFEDVKKALEGYL